MALALCSCLAARAAFFWKILNMNNLKRKRACIRADITRVYKNLFESDITVSKEEAQNLSVRLSKVSEDMKRANDLLFEELESVEGETEEKFQK